MNKDYETKDIESFDENILLHDKSLNKIPKGENFFWDEDIFEFLKQCNKAKES